MTNNTSLHKARKARQDEFYTRLEDIEKELQHYPGAFRDKVVYLNTDDPKHSQFWAFFADNFATLGLEQLIATHYTPGATSSTATVKTRTGTIAYSIEGDGDFRSPESIELLKESDMVVTNPPFSLFREFVAQLIEHGKQFLIIGNMNAITYKDIFPLIKGVTVWLGVEKPKRFAIPDGVEGKNVVEVDGVRFQLFGNTLWFTNLDHRKRHEDLDLIRYYEGYEDEYPKYDNYDAIEVSRVANIPRDYDGVMGVPITFLGKHNPNQFEIVTRNGFDDVPHQLVLHGNKVYARVFVKRRG